jgi:hypothetical protein
MAVIGDFFRRVAAVLVLFALVSAPVAEAATHGPGAVVAEAGHAAWHSEMGHHGHHGNHGHHDATDHDHSASVVLPTAPEFALPQGKAHRSARVRDFAGIGGEGLRRPPKG